MLASQIMRIRTIGKVILIVGGVLVLLIAFTYLIRTPGRRGLDRIRSSNHPALLAACRELIATRQGYFNERHDTTWSDGIYIDGKSAQFQQLPRIIQDLGPHFVVVYTDHVMIYVAIPPRAVVFAYAEGAQQWGTTKLIDGLWLWGD